MNQANGECLLWALFCRTAWTPEGQKTGLKPTMTRITKSFVCQRRVQIWRDGIFGGLGLHPHLRRILAAPSSTTMPNSESNPRIRLNNAVLSAFHPSRRRCQAKRCCCSSVLMMTKRIPGACSAVSMIGCHGHGYPAQCMTDNHQCRPWLGTRNITHPLRKATPDDVARLWRGPHDGPVRSATSC